jgi:ribonuclease HII
MPKRRQLRAFDLKKIEGFESLIGVDEAGRGALAGPVVAGAVLVTREFLEGRWACVKAGRVNDSKLLSAADRDGAVGRVRGAGGPGPDPRPLRRRPASRRSSSSTSSARPSWPCAARWRAFIPRRPSPETRSRTLFSSIEEREAFKPDGLLPDPDRRPALAPFPYPHTAW